MRRRHIFILICAFLCAALLFTACGENGFRKVADFIAEKGELSTDGSYTSVTGKGDGAYYSAMYYADDDELAIGLRKNTDDGADAVILIVRDDGDYCDLLFTRQATSEKDPYFAARAKLLPADPICRRLSEADGGNSDNTDAELLALVNGYIVALLTGADAYLFVDSGLRMADLGFKY